MSRTQTLTVPQHAAGTDLRPVLTLMPVPATGPHGGAEVEQGGGSGAGTLLKGGAAALLVSHLVVAGVTLKDAVAIPDFVWDTAGIPKKAALVKIALVPFVGVPAYRTTIKPKLTQAQDALRLQGG